jgi:hypothetical protein
MPIIAPTERLVLSAVGLISEPELLDDELPPPLPLVPELGNALPLPKLPILVDELSAPVIVALSGFPFPVALPVVVAVAVVPPPPGYVVIGGPPI